MTLAERLAARPGRALAALAAAQLCLWTLAPALTHSAPPLDMLEMLVWGREGVVATYKHPNLPGLMLEAVRRLSSGALWPGYLLAQACVAASFAAVWLLGRELLGPGRALAGALLLTGVFYYSWPTPELNHNLVQMPLWAWTSLALWRAVARDGIGRWLLLGLLGGLSLWAKYSSGLLLLAAALWMVLDGPARARLRRPGPWIALATALATAAPQLHFLLVSDFLPFDYALARAGSGRAEGPLGFLLAQTADHGVFLIMAAGAGLFGAGALRREASEFRARRFLAVMGLGPALLAALAAALAGFGMKDMWGMPMFNLSGLLLLALLPGRFEARRLARLAVMAAGLLALLPAAYAASVLLRAELSDKPSRAVWPQREIAERLLAGYRAETGRDPTVVAGPLWEAGLVALLAPGAPSVSIDGEGRKSPWADALRVRREGALAVWRGGRAPPPALEAAVAGQAVRRESFRWSASPSARPIRLAWTVIPPRAPETRRSGSPDR